MPSGDAGRARSTASAADPDCAGAKSGSTGSWTATGAPAGPGGAPAAAAFDAGSIRGRARVAGESTPGTISAGVSSRAAATTCAATGIDGDETTFAEPGAGSGGGSGHPASGGESTLGGETMATGLPSCGAAGSGMAGSVS